MIATKDSFEPHSSEQLPASKKIFVEGTLHQDVRVPMREIEVSPTKSYTGAVTPNDPVRVYDCSGPWGDPVVHRHVRARAAALRRDWIFERGDVEEIVGREVKPQDNGYLSGKHAEYASKAEKNRLVEFPGPYLATPSPAPCQGGQGRHATRLRPRRHHHARDGIHRHPREHGPREDRRDVEGQRSQRPQQTARRFIAARREPYTPSIFSRFPSASPRRSRPSSSR
jgi:phosphomethylpyrimidine synthase